MVDVSLPDGSKARRNLSVYDSNDNLLREDPLEDIELGTDGSKPTAIIGDQRLTQDELAHALTDPAISARLN